MRITTRKFINFIKRDDTTQKKEIVKYFANQSKKEWASSTTRPYLISLKMTRRW